MPFPGSLWLKGGALTPGLVLVGTLHALPPAAAAQGGESLRVCFLEDDLPRAQRSPRRGFDLEVMEAVAAALGSELVPVWSPSRTGFSEIESTDLPLRSLVQGKCDAVPSVPGAAALGRLRTDLVLSRPYYGAAFELVADEGLPASLEALAGRRVGVRLQSLAHAVVQILGLDWRARPAAREVLELLDDGEVDGALIWGPALALLERRPGEGYEPPQALRFNEHIAVRSGFTRLDEIDRTLRELETSGVLDDWARKYRIPQHRPFASTSDRHAIAALRRGRSFSLGALSREKER